MRYEMEELISLWIYQYKNIEDKITIPLSSKYKIHNSTYDDNNDILEFDIDKVNIHNIYGNNINLKTIVGKNGSGKSNITTALVSILRYSKKNKKDNNNYFEIDLPVKYCLIYRTKNPYQNNKSCYRYKTNIKHCNIKINNEDAEKGEETYTCALFRPFLQIEDDEKLDFSLDQKWFMTSKTKLNNYFYYDRFRGYETNHFIKNFYANNLNNKTYLFKNSHSYLFFDLQAREINLKKRIEWLERQFNIVTTSFYKSQGLLKQDFKKYVDGVKKIISKCRSQMKYEHTFIYDFLGNKIFPMMFLVFTYILLGKFIDSLHTIKNNNIYEEIMKDGIDICNNSKSDFYSLHLKLAEHYSRINQLIKQEYKYVSFDKEDIFNDLCNILNAYENIEIELAKDANLFDKYLHTNDNNLFVVKKEYMSPIDKDETPEMNFLNNLGLFEINYYKKGKRKLYSFKSLSTGEQRILRFFADFYAVRTKTNVFIFDEMDISWHPEWQRDFISIVMGILKGTKRYINVIFTTHSPMVLSDVPKESIIMLNNSDNNLLVEEPFINTFGSNIHSLLKKPFFLKSTIGTFSENKIKDVVKVYKNKKYDKKNSEQVYKIINLLEDGVQKTILQSMYKDWEKGILTCSK